MKTESESIAHLCGYEEQYQFDSHNEGCAYAGKTVGFYEVYLPTPNGDQDIFSVYYIQDPDSPDHKEYITQEQFENIIQTEHDRRNHTPWVHRCRDIVLELFEI